MKHAIRSFTFAATALLVSSGLCFSSPGSAHAWFWGKGDAATRGSVSTAGSSDVKAKAVAEKSANCEKCHSACENGRSHEGVVPAALPEGSSLLLSADGRATCSTCHATHAKGAVVTGSSLRMPNLQRELCLTCHAQPAATTAGRVEIISPLEGAVIQESRVAFIGRTSGLAGAQLTVRLNGAEFHLHAKDGHFATWLTLQDGVNRVELNRDGRTLWQGEIFHGSSSLANYERLSSGHHTGSRAQCQDCHGTGAAVVKSPRRTAALCFECHDRNDEKRYVHGPLAVGACLSCHDPHGGYGTAHLRKEQTLLCGNCHGARENLATAACAAPGKGCVDCHDPHQSDVRYLLKGPQYTMRVDEAR